MRRALFALALAIAMVAAVPAVALAQDCAGCGQYEDPLGPGGGGGNPGGGNPGGGGGGSPGTTGSTPVTSSTPGATASAGGAQGEATASAEATETPTATGEIPRTGFPVGWLMLAGGALLASGLSLRRVAGTFGA